MRYIGTSVGWSYIFWMHYGYSIPSPVKYAPSRARELHEIMAEEYYFALHASSSLSRCPLRVMQDTLQVSHYITKDMVIAAAL